MNKRKIAKVMLGTILLIGIFYKNTLPQAKSFLMALAPQMEWRAKDAEDLKDTKDWEGLYGYIQLDKIQDKDSYTVKARAVKDPNGYLVGDYNIYSETRTVRQGSGRQSIYEGNGDRVMKIGKTYYLSLQNLNYTNDYRNSVGSFGWL